MSVWPGYYSGLANGSATGKMYARLNCPRSVVRLPTDPLFYSDVELTNIVAGSRYWIALASDPDTVLASGTAASTTVTESGIPVYTNPQLLLVRVRKSSASTKYFPLTVYGYQDRNGASIYISQVADGIATT